MIVYLIHYRQIIQLKPIQSIEQLSANLQTMPLPLIVHKGQPIMR